MRHFALSLGVFALAACHATFTDTYGSGSTHDGGTIVSDEIWAAGTHQVAGAITVQGAKVIIEAGSTVTMAPGTSITVGAGGSLLVMGSSAQRVIFTSDSVTPGDWNGIVFEGTASAQSIIQNANLAYAGGYGAALTVKSGATLTLNYTRIEQSADYGLQLQGRTVLSGFTDNIFVNNTLGPAAVDADSAEQLLSTGSVYTPNGQEGVVVEATTLGHSAEWQDLGVAYVTDNVTIAATTGQAILSLDANVIVQVLPGKFWDVSTNGALAAHGTQGHPVIFSSAKTTPARGDWNEISFESDSIAASNKLSWTIVEYGGGNPNGYGELWVGNSTQVAIDNSLFQQSANLGIDATDTDSAGANAAKLPHFTANQFQDNGSWGIAVAADTADQLQSDTLYGGATDAVGVLVMAGTVAHSCTWAALGVPYVVHPANLTTGTSLSIGHSTSSPVVTLTLDANVELRFASTVIPQVLQYGQLLAQGTAQEPVIFTAEFAATGWNQLGFHGIAGNVSSLTYANFSYGGLSGNGQIWLDSGTQLQLSNVTFTGSAASPCNIVLTGSASATGAAIGSTCSR